jgi:hypothetical protein
MAGLTPHEFCVKIAEYTRNSGVIGVLSHIHKELKECRRNGGTRQVTQAITPAHARSRIHDHKAVTMASRGNAIPKPNIHAQGVTYRGNLGLLSTFSTFEVNKAADSAWSLTSSGDMAPCGDLLNAFPIQDATVAKELVQFFVGVADHLRSSGVWDVLGGDVPGAVAKVSGKGGEASSGLTPGPEREPHVGGFGRDGGNWGKVGDTTWRGWSAWQAAVSRVVNRQGKLGVPQETSVMGGKEVGVLMQAAVEAD